jgi:serine-type D-Ala-D-Ala carboxypeptidase
MVEPLHLLLDDAVARGVVSAAAIAVGDAGREVLVHAVGVTRTAPTPGTAIDERAIFDLASVTKPMATAAIAMALVSRGRLDLDRPARELIGGAAGGALDPRITVLHLLGHGAGFPAHRLFYERIYAGDLAGQPDPRAALVHMAATTPLDRPPGVATVYTDLGYITLGAALEGAGGAPLEALFADLVAAPLGLSVARFVDLRTSPQLRPPWPAAVVATEVCPRRGLVTGEVHDDNCHSAGGIAGHAGLFAPVREVSAFAAAIAAAVGCDDVGGLRADVVRRFVTTSAAPDTCWRLGWDTPSPVPGESHAGDRWPRDGGFGHTGFTGTSLWIDPARRRWVALLGNRVHPSRAGDLPAAIKPLRRAVMDRVVAELDRRG